MLRGNVQLQTDSLGYGEPKHFKINYKTFTNCCNAELQCTRVDFCIDVLQRKRLSYEYRNLGGEMFWYMAIVAHC